MFNLYTQYTIYSLCFSVLPSLKLTWYQSQINLLVLWFLKPPVALSEKKKFLSKDYRASLLPPLLPKTSVYHVLPTTLIVRARFPKPENFITRNLPMRRHTPRLSPASPPVPISIAAVRLLRLSCASHPLICLVKTNLHPKSHRQKPSHAPSRADEASSEILFSDPRTPTRDPTRPQPALTIDVSLTYCWHQP